MTTATVLGSTGLVGAHMLSQLLSHASVASVYTVSRRTPSETSPKLNATINTDSSTWPAAIKSNRTDFFFSGLGTTRADAGSFAAQKLIDHDLNVDCARAAKEAGMKTYVLISAAGVNANSWFAYPAMKAQLENDVIALGFEKTVIVRPGLIVGDRERSRWAEKPLHVIAKLLPDAAKDSWAQSDEMIARAAVRSALEEEVWKGRELMEGKDGGKVWIMTQKEIVELGGKQ